LLRLLASDFPSENPRTQTRNFPYTSTLATICKMTKHTSIFLAFLTFSILISCNQKTSEKKVTDKPIPESVDYHKIIDLVMENHSETEINLYNFDIKYLGQNNGETLNDLKYVMNNTDSKSQSELLKKLISKQDSFVFKKSNLNSKTTELLILKEIKSKDKIIYVFNSFLTNKLHDSIVANISVLYSNEEYGGIKGGWEEIAFFSKENENWKTDKRIEYIEY
jgi:hypothetical protein